ncbi:LOW QUALITY PROTEIN: hemin import ATP-binding protein hmuV, partial [Streptomyces viridosporus ATCC 14672]
MTPGRERDGAGKSTLLSALAADLPPTAGTVRIHRRPAPSWSAPELALRRAVLPQSASLSFPFTVEEVVRMGRAPWAAARLEDDDAVVAEAMAATEVTGFAARPFSALSGGERARVALARVLAQRAPLLMLDEPTAALDLRHQELVLRLCRARARAGDAVVGWCTTSVSRRRTRTGWRSCAAAGSPPTDRRRRSSPNGCCRRCTTSPSRCSRTRGPERCWCSRTGAGRSPP